MIASLPYLAGERVTLAQVSSFGAPREQDPSAPRGQVSLEIATERGVPITAPQEWVKLATRAGFVRVRVRSQRGGEQPATENRGTTNRPAYHVVGILTANGTLHLPGANFTRRSGAALADFVDRLAADGTKNLTAERGNYGLTLPQFEALYTDLAQPMPVKTRGETVTSLLEQLRPKLRHEIEFSPKNERVVGKVPIFDELEQLSCGTALSILLRQYQLGLAPVKTRGRLPRLRIIELGQSDEDEIWPAGWKIEGTPRETAPKLYKFIPVEIADQTLAKTLEVIIPRVGIPLFFDRDALARKQVDPQTAKVNIRRTKTFYKRIIDRLLSQAKLGAQLRTDEAGTPFLLAK